MKIVIDISEDDFDYIYDLYADGDSPDEKSLTDTVMYAIANGIVLPKGHGRILDEKDILDTENNDGGWYDLVDMPEYIAGVKAIIEADKSESDDKR